MRPRDRRSVALAIGAILTLALAGSTLAVGRPGPDGMAVMRVRDAHGSHGHGPGGGGGNSNPNLYSHGGTIEATPQVYISLWGSEWTGSTYDAATAYVEGFFQNVGGSSWIKSTTQYCSGPLSDPYTCPGDATYVGDPSGQLSDVWNDPATVPNRPKQSDIAAAASRLKSHELGLGRDVTDATFFVFTPSGKSMNGFGSQWCAWHSSSGSMAYAYIPYMPDAGWKCGENSVNSGSAGIFDGFSIVAGHEYAEAETDPLPSSGWLDSSGQENGDKCAWTGLQNISLGGSQFAVQPLWSNNSASCVISYP